MKAEHKTLFDCDVNWTFAKLCSEICEKKNIVIDENMFDSKPSAYVGSCDGLCELGTASTKGDEKRLEMGIVPQAGIGDQTRIQWLTFIVGGFTKIID